MLSEKAANRERSQTNKSRPFYTGWKVAGAGYKLELKLKYFLFWERHDNFPLVSILSHQCRGDALLWGEDTLEDDATKMINNMI